MCTYQAAEDWTAHLLCSTVLSSDVAEQAQKCLWLSVATQLPGWRLEVRHMVVHAGLSRLGLQGSTAVKTCAAAAQLRQQGTELAEQALHSTCMMYVRV